MRPSWSMPRGVAATSGASTTLTAWTTPRTTSPTLTVQDDKNRRRRWLSSLAATASGVDTAEDSSVVAPFDVTASSPSSSSAAQQVSTILYTPLLDFAQSDTLNKIERLDDAIMGGISTSTVIYCNNCNGTATPATSSSFAKWCGVCREDGGGFCGWRTNPFRDALPVTGYDGIYMKCRFASDDEPHRRIWKFSTRTRPDRGELLFQAPFTIPTKDDGEDWSTIQIPFDAFRLVRGPRVISNAPLLNVSSGLYQLGTTMSKFVFTANNLNTTATDESRLVVLDSFRAGYFALDLKEIGVYCNNAVNRDEVAATIPPDLQSKPHAVILSHDETKRYRPWYIQKVLIPLSQLLFFSEQSQRRKSAMKLLVTQRNLSRLQAIQWGFQLRQRQFGIGAALIQTTRMLAEDVVRWTLSMILKVTLVYPLRLVSLLGQVIKRRKVVNE